MTATHQHLLLNHWPIFASFFGLALLGIGYFNRGEGRRWLTRAALGLFIFGAIAAVPANTTGEGAEEEVEHLPNIPHSVIHEHEEAAEAALVASGVLGAVALLALLLEARDHRYTRIVMLATLLLALATTGLMTRAGLEGGKIRRPELRDAK